MTLDGSAIRFLHFIRFSHTVFAMPFALGAMFVAAEGLPPWRVIVLIVLAMIFARTAAMCFNRVADWELDKRNPRTAGRHHLASKRAAIVVCALASAAFVATAGLINPLCFALSPVALVIVFFYSVTKRFTSFAQFFLGLALSVAPVGAWLAVRGRFEFPPFVLAAGVVCWVAGFDIIYATQDYEVDMRERLQSMVVWLGVPRALALARVLHAMMWVALCGFGVAAGLGTIYYIGVVLVLPVLLSEHRAARSRDVAAINLAFFRSNAAIGIIFVSFTVLDRLV